MKDRLHGAFRVVRDFLAALLLTYTLASVSHSSQILGALAELGVSIASGDALGMLIGDWLGLYLFAAVIATGLLIGFVVARLLLRWRAWSSVPLYAVAGALALLCIHISMQWLLSLSPIAGARGTTGLLLQCLSGAAGGALYGFLRGRHSRRALMQKNYCRT